ncbi:MAG: flagellin [Alphaproteobacteria bacterium]|nr:flagellin [Alphaproteobacteria bacterium]
MVGSINNTTGVLAALKALQGASSDLSQAETRVSSGYKVRVAADNAPAFQTSAILNGEVNSLQAVTLSLNHAQSVSDVSIAAAQQVSDLLISMKGTASAAMAGDLSDDQRQAYNLQFQQQRAQLTQFIQNASFDDANVLNGSKPNGITFIVDAAATQTVTLKGRDFLPGGSVVTLSTTSDLSSPDAAQHAYDAITQSITNVGAQLIDMSSENKRIEAQAGFVAKLSDALTSGVSTLVDTDVAGDSALIQALQVKQSLAGQAVSIANNAPQALLALFR